MWQRRTYCLPTNLQDRNLGCIYDTDAKFVSRSNTKENCNEISIDIPNEDTLENIRGSDFIEAVDTNIATEINKSV